MDEYFVRFGEVRDYLHRLVADARKGRGTPRRCSGAGATCPT
jgi:hypothetical protein